MLIDSHAHIDFPDFAGKEGEVVKRAQESDVLKIINVGVDLERSKKSIEIARRFKGTVFATVGLHPHDSKLAINNKQLADLKKLAENPEVIAIGECGLDFFRVDREEEKQAQKNLFETQIYLADDLNLPLIIHTRDAEEETLEIIKAKKIKMGVAHCFTGTLDFAKELIDLGFYIGFTGIVTFDKTGNLEKVIKEIPLERILVETDAPFLAPVPYRGKTNEPAYVVEVVKKIAEIRGLNFEEASEITAKNTEKLFNI